MGTVRERDRALHQYVQQMLPEDPNNIDLLQVGVLQFRNNLRIFHEDLDVNNHRSFLNVIRWRRRGIQKTYLNGRDDEDTRSKDSSSIDVACTVDGCKCCRSIHATIISHTAFLQLDGILYRRQRWHLVGQRQLLRHSIWLKPQ